MLGLVCWGWVGFCFGLFFLEDEDEVFNSYYSIIIEVWVVFCVNRRFFVFTVFFSFLTNLAFMEYQNYVTETAENAGFQESCSDAKLRKLIASLGFFVGAQEE